MQDANAKRFKDAQKKVRELTSDDENVNGSAIGYRTVNGVETDELVVVVYVSKKRPASYVSSRKLLPRSVPTRDGDVTIDVVEAGPFYSLELLSRVDQTREVTEVETASFVEDVFTERVRPVPYGVSIGHYDITAGTFGCLVTSLPDNTTQILSNNHVLGKMGTATIGDAIVQPGTQDGGTLPADRIATLTRMAPINPTGVNLVDAAIAAPVTSSDVTTASAVGDVGAVGSPSRAVGLLFAGDCRGNILACHASNVASALSIAFPGGHAIPSVGDAVQKVGRTTGWTLSRITSVNGQFTVGYDGLALQFDQLIVIPEMGHAGDSGSLILEAADD